MSSKDKDSKSLPDKLKEFFKRNKGSASKLKKSFKTYKKHF